LYPDLAFSTEVPSAEKDGTIPERMLLFIRIQSPTQFSTNLKILRTISHAEV